MSLPVTIRPGGLISVVIPSDPAVVARREAALAAHWRAVEDDWDAMRSALPHRREVRPAMLERQERLQQDRSLGWRKMEDDRNLWPMSGERYVRTLIGNFPELRHHLAEMDAEMASRPEEYAGRGFDLALWRTCAVRLMQPDEFTLVAFIAWVVAPDSDAGRAAQREVLRGLMEWSERSRQQFGIWVAHPFFPDLG